MDILNLPTNNTNEIPPALPTPPPLQPPPSPKPIKNFIKGLLLVILTPFIFKIIISLIFLVRFWIDSQRISFPAFLYDFVGAIITCAIIYLLAKVIKLGKAKIFSTVVFVALVVLLVFLDFFYNSSFAL